jgi:hypothetical protein
LEHVFAVLLFERVGQVFQLLGIFLERVDEAIEFLEESATVRQTKLRNNITTGCPKCKRTNDFPITPKTLFRINFQKKL